MSDFKDVLYDAKQGVATITINRPKVLNALRFETVLELVQAFDKADEDPTVGVIVLTGSGERAFCTGGDVNVEDALDRNKGRQFAKHLMRLSETIRSVGKPVIAKIKGWCIGGGNELNLICDLSIAADTALFGQVGPRMGSIPIWYGTQLLTRLVGEKRSKEIVFLCEKYSATRAEALGWINKVVPEAELDAAVEAWCQRLLGHSPQAIRVAKLSINFESDQLAPSVKHGFELLTMVHDTDEFHEGTRAFLEKRKPEFNRFR